MGNLDDRTLTRIDAAQRLATATVSLDERTPTGLAVGAGGVWVAHGMRGQVSRVDPQFDRITSTIDVATGRARTGSTAVGEGSVWAVFGDSTFARIDPADARVAASSFAGAAPSAVVVASGAVWVANSGDSDVQRFNPRTFEQGAVRTIPSADARPQSPSARGRSGWRTHRTTRSHESTPARARRRTIGVGLGPTAVAVGSGAVWVANTTDRTISRIDPATNQVVGTIEIGDAPYGVAVDDGLVWVAVQAP